MKHLIKSTLFWLVFAILVSLANSALSCLLWGA